MHKFNVLQLITDSKVGGAERVVLLLAKELNKERFNVSVCCLAKRGPIFEEMEEVGIKIDSLGMRNRRDFLKIFRLFKILKSKNIHIIHSHLFHANIVGRIIGRLAGIPIIISSEHTMGLEGKLRSFVNWITAGLTDKIIAVSYGVRDFLIKETHIESDKITVIWNGIDYSKFSSDYNREPVCYEEFGFSKTDKIIGTVTHLYRNKGIEYLLLAAKEVLEIAPGVKFLIVGDGPLKKHLQELVKRLNIEKQVVFSGFRRDVKHMLDTIRIFVHPSLFEGLPITILEAMAMKKPVVATKVGGIIEVVKDGLTGILVEPKNSHSLANAILGLLNDTVLAERMAEAGYSEVKEHFNMSRMLKETEELYDRLLEDKIKC